MRDVIPSPVFDAVQSELRERAALAQYGWESASEDEDTLTGAFCESLRTDWKETEASDGTWCWRIQYKKFRGRGGKALEKHIGADGIFQIEVHRPGGLSTPKGVLFQAKKVRGSSRSDLDEQVRKMEAVAPEGSAVFEFGPKGYLAASGAIVIAELDAGPGRIPHPTESIGTYLGDRFLSCESGILGMNYDAVRGHLLIPVNNTIRVVPVSLGHRVRIEIVHESQEGPEVETQT